VREMGNIATRVNRTTGDSMRTVFNRRISDETGFAMGLISAEKVVSSSSSSVYLTAVARDEHAIHYPRSGQRPPGGESWASPTIASSVYN
jgi:hypothetical protein